MVVPPLLKNGDLVAVVATARVVDAEAVRSGIDIIESWGLRVEQGSSLYHSHNLFAGTDLERQNDLQSALNNANVKAIFCARGGYGTTRILDSLDWSAFRQSPKWICGFSDVTSLHGHLHSLGFASIHSSMPQLFGLDGTEEDIRSLKRTLFDGPTPLQTSPHTSDSPGFAEGLLVGGNLSLLVHLIGTNSDFNTEGKILLLEEVDEYLYHLDRMMVQLARSEKLQALAGVAVGHLTKMKEGNLSFGTDATGVISSHLDHLDIPIGFGFPFGHQSPNLAIPMGVKGTLDVGPNGSTLEYQSSHQST